MKTKCRFTTPQAFMLGSNLVYRFFDVIAICNEVSRTNFAQSHWQSSNKGIVFYSATSPSSDREKIMHMKELAPYTDASEVAHMAATRACDERYKFKAVVSDPHPQVTALSSKAMYPVMVGQFTGSILFYDLYYTDKLSLRDKVVVSLETPDLPLSNVVRMDNLNYADFLDTRLFDKRLYSVCEDMIYVRD